MGYTRVRTTNTGQDRYTAYYHDIRGGECSAGTFGHKRQADRAWRRAEGRIAEGRFLDVRSRPANLPPLRRRCLAAPPPHGTHHPPGLHLHHRQHLMPALGPMRMAEILPSDIRTFLGELHANGVPAATAQRCKTVLGAIFTTALADGVVFLHPCRGVKGPAIGKTPVRILTPTELARLRAAFKDERWRLWLDTAVETGARWGELAELRVTDLNPAVRTLTIARTLLELQPPFHPDHGQFLVKPYPKNRDFRVLRLSRALTTRLTAHILSHQLDPGDLLFGGPTRRTAAHDTTGTDTDTVAGIGAGGPASNAVAETPHGRIATYTNHGCRCSQCRLAYARYRATRRAAGQDRPPVPHTEPDPHLSRHWFRKQIWNPATKAASLTHRLRIHDLRHTNASWMIAGGADLQTVRERLGHASLRATERYLHTLPDTDDTALHALATVRNHRPLHRPGRRGVRHGHLTVAHTRKPLR